MHFDVILAGMASARSRILRTAVLGCLVAAITATAAAPAAMAAEPKPLGTYKAWSAYLLKERKKLICYLHSEPAKQVGKYKKRGDTFLQVSHRPADKVRNEISLTSGYTYKKDSDVRIEIDGAKFSLFTDRDGAWARDSKTDTRLVRAMMKGKRMVVRGVSSRGTETTDTYRLSGFTAAHKAMSKACKVK